MSTTIRKSDKSDKIDSAVVFRKNVSERIEKAGVSITEIARRANLSRVYVSELLNDSESNPTFAAADAIASALGVSLPTLLRG